MLLADHMNLHVLLKRSRLYQDSQVFPDRLNGLSPSLPRSTIE